MAQSYWYDISSSQVVRADERESEAWLGPFGSAQEAEEAPQTFIAYATEFLNSELGREYLEIGKRMHPDEEINWPS